MIIILFLALSSQLFGECDAENDVSPDTELIPAEGREEMEIESNGKEHLSTRLWAEKNEYDPVKLLEKVGKFLFAAGTRVKCLVQLFSSDIEYLLTMDKLWQSRRPPIPLSLTHHPEKGRLV